MKAAYRVRVCAVLLISVALICSPSWGSYPYAKLRPESLKQKPLQFSPPEPHRAVLPNGMVVYVLEDRSLPLVSVAAYVKAGSVYDPPERIGLASIVGSVMRTGGAAGKSGDQIDEELETIAASVDCSVGSEYATVRLSTLSRHCEKALQLFADILTKPDFQEDKLNLDQTAGFGGHSPQERLSVQHRQPRVCPACVRKRKPFGRGFPHRTP